MVSKFFILGEQNYDGKVHAQIFKITLLLLSHAFHISHVSCHYSHIPNKHSPILHCIMYKNLYNLRMNDQIHSMFEGSLRVTSAPVSSSRSHRSKSAGRISSRQKMNGVFEIPLTDRSDSSARTSRKTKTPRPAWSQVQPKVSASQKKTPKPKQVETEDFSKTKTVKKDVLSPRISVSQSFHIKNPDLIESIAATKTDESLKIFQNYENEFERRDQAAATIQKWWRTRLRRRKKSARKSARPLSARQPKPAKVSARAPSEHKRTKSSPAEVQKVTKVRTPRRADDDIARARAKLVGQIKSARVEKKTTQVSEKPATSRPYDHDLDQSIKFSARIQSSRKNKDYSKRHEFSPSPRQES